MGREWDCSTGNQHGDARQYGVPGRELNSWCDDTCRWRFAAYARVFVNRITLAFCSLFPAVRDLYGAR